MALRPPILHAARSRRFFFRRQGRHALALLVLVPVAWAFAAPAAADGAWLGVSAIAWFWAGLVAAVLHQVLGWAVWRAQLGWGVFTRLFGRWDMFVWGLLFAPFLLARPLLVAALAIADRGSLALPAPVAVALGAGLLVPALYTLYSTARYFGVARALGGDHFRRRYRHMPLVREGAFRWTGNAMYALAFLLLWSIALFAGSQAALALALFQHAYIWVHYRCTEQPDMELIYGGGGGMKPG